MMPSLLQLQSSWVDWDAIFTSCIFILVAAAIIYCYHHTTAIKTRTTKTHTNPKVLRKSMTPIGKFALLSQTERNPSIISFFIALASKDDNGMGIDEFEQLWKEVLMKNERFRFHVSEENNNKGFEEVSNNEAFIHDYTIEVSHSKDPEEFKARVNQFLTSPIDVLDSPWEINLSSGPIGSSGAIINSKELIAEGYTRETVALFRVHHVICDGVSMSKVVKDICDEKDKLDRILLDAVEKYKAHVKRMGVLKRLAGFLMYYFIGSMVALSLQFWHMITSVNPFDALIEPTAKRNIKRSVCWKFLDAVDDAKQVAKSIGHHTKLNDLFVSLASKALERQYENVKNKSGQTNISCPSAVSIVVPVHLQGSILPGQSIGNKVGAFVARIPFNPTKQTSSLQRLSKISKIMNVAKHTPAPLISWFLTSLLSKLGIVSLAKDAIVRANCHAVAVISNVHGYPFEIHWNGRPIKMICPFLPLPPQIGIGIMATSYDGKIILSVESGDERVVPDAEVFLDFMLEEYEAIKQELAQKE